jgi:hypothetical protein
MTFPDIPPDMPVSSVALICLAWGSNPQYVVLVYGLYLVARLIALGIKR